MEMVRASLTRQQAPHEEPFCLPHRHLPKQTANRAARRPMELKRSPLQGCTESAEEPIPKIRGSRTRHQILWVVGWKSLKMTALQCSKLRTGFHSMLAVEALHLETAGC